MSPLEWLMWVGIIGVVSSLTVVQLQEKAEAWDARRHEED